MPEVDGSRDLADRRAIADVLIRYCRYLDAMDLEALAALFTINCRVSYGPDPNLNSEGRDDLRRDLERLWRWRRTSHHLSNISVEFEGPDIARAHSYVLAWHERADGQTATVYGRYQDRLIRTDDGWLIDERLMFMNGHDTGFGLGLHLSPRHAPPPGWKAPEIDK